ncbi:unnamed protein product [Diamesa serratosioi]
MEWNEEITNTMNRIQNTKGTKEGKMLINGTIMIKDQQLKTTFDSTTTVNYVQKLTLLKDICRSVVRTIDPTDDLESLKVNFVDKTNTEVEVMLAVENDFMVIVSQNHQVRDLRKRNIKGYKHFQKNLFFPSMD